MSPDNKSYKINTRFTNDGGKVELTVGGAKLFINGPSDSRNLATYQVATEADVTFGGTVTHKMNGVKFTGSLVAFPSGDGGKVQLDGTLRCESTVSAAVPFTGAGNLEVVGMFTAAAGTTFEGAGTLDVKANGILQFANQGQNDTYSISRPVSNSGKFRLTCGGKVSLAAGANFQNTTDGVVELKKTTTLSDAGGATPATFTNSGTIKQLDDTNTIEVPVTGSGTIDLIKGTLKLTKDLDLTMLGGTIKLADGTTLDVTGKVKLGMMAVLQATGTGSVKATELVNGGTVSLGVGNSVGSINLTGDYTQSAMGTLKVIIPASNAIGKLTVSGNAALGGTLSMAPVPDHTPASGTTFTPLSYGTKNGTFGTVSGGYTASYGGTDLTVTKD